MLNSQTPSFFISVSSVLIRGRVDRFEFLTGCSQCSGRDPTSITILAAPCFARDYDSRPRVPLRNCRAAGRGTEIGSLRCETIHLPYSIPGVDRTRRILPSAEIINTSIAGSTVSRLRLTNVSIAGEATARKILSSNSRA